MAPPTTSPKYLKLEHLRQLVTDQTLKGLFDDDGDEQVEGAKFAMLARAAEAEASTRLLRNGWSHDDIKKMAESDALHLLHVAWICLEFATEGRQEFVAEDGKGRYDMQYKRGCKYFDELSRDEQDSPAKALVAAGANQGGRLSPTLTTGEKRFVFAASRDDKTGPGGF